MQKLLVILALTLPSLGQVIELPCPTNTQVIPVVGQTRDGVTGGVKDWLCVDALGNVNIQGSVSQPVVVPIVTQAPLMFSGFRATANSLQVINYFGSGVNANISGQANTLVYPGATTITAVCNATLTCQTMANTAFQAVATASTSTVVGNECCANANSGSYPILSWNRVTFKASFGTVATNANSRWWLGLSVFANGSALGINGTATLGTTAYAQDLPNKTTIGFRCNVSSDVTWKAVQIQAGASPTSTVQDTGVICDTNIHIWEMTLSPDSSTLTWYIDGRLVAQSASIINLSVANTNVLDVMSQLFYTGDNKNTVTQVGMVFFYAIIQERQ